MSQYHLPALRKLEDEPIWQIANELAEYFYSILPNFPEEEKWNSESKTRQEANNLVFSAGEALGNIAQTISDYEWGSVRKAASGLKTIYRFAGRQKFITIDPDIMVKLNKLLALIDVQVIVAFEASEAYNQRELERWRERYQLWKQLETEMSKARLQK
jgi:hypothetical protein